MRPPAGTLTYRGADATLLRTTGWAVLLGVPPGHPLVRRCWDLLVAAAGVDDVLEALAPPDAAEAPAYAVLHETGDPQLVTGGVVALVLDEVALPPEARASVALADVASVTVSVGGGRTSGPALPLGDGVVRASAFHLILAARGAEPGSGGATPVASSDGREREAGTATVAVGGAAAPAPVPVPAPVPEETLPSSVTAVPTPTGRTWARSRDGLVPTPAAPTGGLVTPRVLSVRCPAGHLTPAYADVCRVCRRAVGVQEVLETPRPVLGRLVLPRGDTVLLERGAVLGRAPYVPPDWAGDAPHLVAVPDPDQDVSAQHLTVVLDLWDVLVRDLGSTNGTRLLGADGSVTRLRPHQPVPLRPGGAVVLADVVTVRFEALP